MWGHAISCQKRLAACTLAWNSRPKNIAASAQSRPSDGVTSEPCQIMQKITETVKLQLLLGLQFLRGSVSACSSWGVLQHVVTLGPGNGLFVLLPGEPHGKPKAVYRQLLKIVCVHLFVRFRRCQHGGFPLAAQESCPASPAWRENRVWMRA